MLTTRRRSRRVDGWCVLSRDGQDALRFIANEEARGVITVKQADALQQLLVSLYLSECFHAKLEPYIEKSVEGMQQRLEKVFGALLALSD